LLFFLLIHAVSAIAPEHFQVTFDTSVKAVDGKFVVDVHRAYAPHGVDRFYDLVRRGYYNGNTFFRVVPHFVVQWGLAADPQLTAQWRTANIEDDPVKMSNMEGTITFATAGPGTRTTQLFVNMNDNSRLDDMGFSPFGRVTKGMDVVRHIFSGYGEQPDQGEITYEGNRYLQASFPRLDFIRSASITPFYDDFSALNEVASFSSNVPNEIFANEGMSVTDLKRALQTGNYPSSARNSLPSRPNDGLFHDADKITLRELGIDAPERDLEQERVNANMQVQLKQLELLHKQIAAKKKLLQQAQAAFANIHLSGDSE